MIIPADVRIIESRRLKINRTWNGRSGVYEASNISTSANILKAGNMAFFPSICVGGEGKGFVVSAGANTVLSKMIQA